MAMRSLTKTLIGALAASAALAGALRADLAQASPFLPPNSPLAAGGAGGPSGPVELRGMMPTDQGIECLIYDTAKKTSVWVAPNESGYDFVVKSVNAANDTATVFYQGRSMQLELRAAKVASAGTAQPGAPGNPVVAPNAPGIPTAADEQRRLDAVAAEVRRRRLEREKAFQTPGSTPPPATPAR
jgi:hypothetical protein